MISSRKAVPPAFDNTLQTPSFVEEAEVFSVQRSDNPQASSSLLPQSVMPRDLNLTGQSQHNPNVMAQNEMAQKYDSQISAPSPAVVPDTATLHIGSAIKMKGSVEDCGILQVDGHFVASAQSRQLKVSKSGIFLGDADVHSAEIVGRFEGDIRVKDRLIIRANGVVTGTVRYGSIEIESGGRISGDIQPILRNEPPIEQTEAVASPAQAEPAQQGTPLRLNLSVPPHNPAATANEGDTVASSNVLPPSTPASAS